MIESDPYKAPAMEPSPNKNQPVPFHEAIFNAWVDLFRPRTNILKRLYTNPVGIQMPDAPEPTSLEEARQRYYAVQQGRVPSDFEENALESKIVLGTRIIAAWIVFWTTIIPTGLIGWFCINRFSGTLGTKWENLWLVFISITIVFPILSILGLCIGALLIRPFNAVLGRFLALPSVKPQEPSVND